MLFSIVIPLYNEERRIPKTVGEIMSFFGAEPIATEIIFVNDGSTDRTQRVLEQFQKQYGFRIVAYPRNRGKGYAIREGVARAAGDWVVFFDIDLATPLAEFTRLRETLTEQDAVVIGSRRLAGSRIAKRESRLRTLLGQGFTAISNVLVPGITDCTCGFKCFSRAAAGIIFPRARIDRWGFDTELLYIARLHRIPIRQMPVTWKHDDDSRVRVLSAVISSLKELALMLWNKLRGWYD